MKEWREKTSLQFRLITRDMLNTGPEREGMAHPCPGDLVPDTPADDRDPGNQLPGS